MFRFVRVLAVAAFVALLPVVASAQSTGPMVGTWVLNAAKSTPMTVNWKQRRMEVTRGPGGLTFTSVTIGMDGTDSRWFFTTKGDGTSVKVTGEPAPDTVTVMLEPTPSGDNLGGANGLFTYKVGDEVVLQSILEVAKDGTSLTIKSVRSMPDGSKTASLTHYDRQ